MVLMSPFVRFKRQQMEEIRVGKPYLLVVNHLSFFDTYCMALLQSTILPLPSDHGLSKCSGTAVLCVWPAILMSKEAVGKKH